ncbi:DapH/DapD/GlmU-related protein [uncultured Bacteroides sp.]|uniref:acyltransferase n=1 Tax=uncultured Bacteroides sp. TaxID=162156 RepID=UPI002629A108|nr:DapH/DapD/GlmU-related protein [uncultured Bacteroides sp.]
MIIVKVLKKVYHLICPPKVKFKHGQRFYSNSLIDTLFPELVEIGDDFISAPGSVILAHDASTFWYTGKYRVQKTKIGNRVFLGANSIILPGVVVGDNVIIGSGSVVTKDITSNSVVAGNPARVISTINEYIDKCEYRKILYSPSKRCIDLMAKGETLTEELKKELRDTIYIQME